MAGIKVALIRQFISHISESWVQSEQTQYKPLFIFLRFFFASGVGFPTPPWDFLHYFTMILQRFRIIVWDARFEPGTSAPEVWCATNEPPHLLIFLFSYYPRNWFWVVSYSLAELKDYSISSPLNIFFTFLTNFFQTNAVFVFCVLVLLFFALKITKTYHKVLKPTGSQLMMLKIVRIMWILLECNGYPVVRDYRYIYFNCQQQCPGKNCFPICRNGRFPSANRRDSQDDQESEAGHRQSGQVAEAAAVSGGWWSARALLLHHPTYGPYHLSADR